MINTVRRGDVRKVLKTMPDEYVDLIVTSPPYWGLRSYDAASSVWGGSEDCIHQWEDVEEVGYDYRYRAGKKAIVGNNLNQNMYEVELHNSYCSRCGAWYGQLGMEPTFQLFIDHLMEIFMELKRVLKDTGTCWVVMGDTYITKGPSRHFGYTDPKNPDGRERTTIEPHALPQSIPEKCMAQIPQRFAIKMTDEGGWILRIIPIWQALNPVLWQKPNPVPESAKDRFTRDYEFIHVFSKSKLYHFETQYEPKTTSKGKVLSWEERKRLGDTSDNRGAVTFNTQTNAFRKDNKKDYRIKRCIWNIPLKGTDWEYCQSCDTFIQGVERQKIRVVKEKVNGVEKKKKFCPTCHKSDGWVGHYAIFPEELVTTPILAGCPANGIVLDPFNGSGTTCVVAKKWGFNYIGIDISEVYCHIAEIRLSQVETSTNEAKVDGKEVQMNFLE